METRPFDHEIGSCRAAQREWAARPIAERLRPLRGLRHRIAESANELTAAVEEDVGRPPGEVLGSDVLPLADACRFLERNAGRLLRPRRVHGTPLWLFGQSDTIYRRPHGVVGVIGTWNYPLLLNGVQLVQALVAGNGVAWKPSEYGRSSADLLGRLLLSAGFPPQLVQVLPADREAGPRLVEADIDHLVFTGSAGVGRQIARRLGERLISSTMELSGCDAMFVLDDADVGLAARAAWYGLTLNRGQTCVAVRRVFVDRAVAPAFVDALRPLAESAKPERLVTAAQVQRARALIADATAAGGQVLGHADGDGRTMGPQLVLNASAEMELCRTDFFAPVAAVIETNGVDDALAMEARCPFALGASVITRDPSRARKLVERLRPLSVCVNDVIAPTAHPGLPFGGRAASGWGATRGPDGLLAMTVPQAVSVRSGTFRPHYERATQAMTESVGGLLDWSHRAKFGARLRGLRRAVRGLFALRRAGKNTGA